MTATTQSVICLHCSGSSPRQWDGLVEHLRPDFVVLAPALRGYGDDRALRARQVVSLEDEATRIAPLFAASAAPVHLVAHSYGAAVALKIARLRPAKVASLTLYEPVLFNLLAQDEAEKPWAQEIVTAGTAIRDSVVAGDLPRAAEIFVDYWSGTGAWPALSKEHQRTLAERMLVVSSNFDTLFAETSTVDAYRGLTAPTLLLVGARTKMPTRRIAHLLAGAMPRATLRELGGMNHMGPIARAAEVNAWIGSFLSHEAQHEGFLTLHPMSQLVTSP